MSKVLKQFVDFFKTMKKKEIAALVVIIVSVVLLILMLVLTSVFSQKASKCPTQPPSTAPATQAPVSTSPSCVPGCTTDQGKRFVGAASDNINGPGGLRMASASECQKKCKDTPGCAQYVYFAPNKLCYLQSKTSDVSPIPDSRFTSGSCKKC
jgi:hypothetical protein